MGRAAGNGRYVALTRQLTLTFPEIAAGASESLALTNAALGLPLGSFDEDAAAVACPRGGLQDGLVVKACWCSNFSTVNVSVQNTTGGALTPVVVPWTIAVIPFDTGL